jgi:tetratricopeptide (TPR) repeat protein
LIRRATPFVLALALAAFAAPTHGLRAEGEVEESVVDVDRLLDEVAAALDRGRYSDAERSLADAEKAAGSLPAPALLQRARILRETGRVEEALVAAVAAVAAAPQDPAALTLHGTLLFERGRRDEAERVFRDAIEVHRISPRLRTALGDLLAASGRRADALASYEESNTIWASLDVTEAEDLVATARARIAIFMLDPEVKPAINRTLEILGPPAKAGDAAARVLIADIYTRHSETGKVANALRPLLDRNPLHPDALAVMAEARQATFDTGEATRHARDALRTNPTHPRAVALLAEVALSDGRDDDAIQLLDAALAVRPAERTLLALRAIPLYLAGDIAGHSKKVDAILALDPTFGRAWALLAHVLEDRRRFGEAVECAKRAVAIDERDADAWFAMARNLLHGGDDVEARRALVASNKVDVWHDPFRKNFLSVLEELDGYIRGTTKHFVTRIHPSEDVVLRPLYDEVLEESYLALRERYGFSPEGPILVEVFRNAADFSARTIGIPGFGAVGACFGRVVTLDSPGALPPGAFSWHSTAHHELAHVFSLQLSKGRVPRWLTEGLAVWEERRAYPAWQRNMERELLSRMACGTVPGLTKINGSFRGPEVFWAYYQGGLMAEWMERDFGWAKVLEMLRTYASDRSDAEVVRSVLGMSPKEFDDGFLAFLKERTAGWSVRPWWNDDRMKEFRERSRRDPADLEAHIGYIEASLQRENTFDAGTPLARAQEKAPTDPRVTELRGRLALATDAKPDRGLALLREALAGGVDHYDLRMVLGRAARSDDRLDEALEHFRRAKVLFPRVLEPRDARVELHSLHIAAARPEDALRELDERLGMDETDLVGRLKAADIHEDRGDLEAVRRLLQECIAIRPIPGPLDGVPGKLYDAAAVFDRLGRTRLALGDAAGAVKAHRSAFAILTTQEPRGSEEQVADVLVELARALLAAGSREDARAAAADALRRVPDHAGALLFLKE